MSEGSMEFYYTQPPSLKSKWFKLLFQLSGLKKIMERFSTSRLLLYLSNAPSPTYAVKQVANIHRHTENSKTVFTLYPKTKTSSVVILYLHGGAFTLNFTRPHWNFISDLIRQNHCTVVAPDFPLLPGYDYKTRLETVYKVYESLIHKMDSRYIVVMGDSSGGNMALALAQLAYENKQHVPGQIILLSPWLDVSMTNTELKTNLPEDPMLSYSAAVKVGKAHAGLANTAFYQVSPLYGMLKDIGKISLFTGTNDILHPDARKLKVLAKEQQADFNYFQYNAMMHTWMLFDMPESTLVKQQISALLHNTIV